MRNRLWIKKNQTRYSTEDMNALFSWAEAYTRAVGNQVERIVPGYSGEVVWNEGRPLVIAYWSGSSGEEASTSVRRMPSGSTSPPYTTDVEGPWWVKSGGEILRLLSPNKLQEVEGPLAALAMAGPGAVLPGWAKAQLMHYGFRRTGVRVRGRGYGHRDASFYRLCQLLSQHPDCPPVRILKNVEDRPVPSTQEEKIRRLLDTYLSGGASRELGWKRWRLRDVVSEYTKHYLTTHEQKKRLLKAGGKPPTAYRSPQQLLRDMADEVERRLKELGVEDG
ncbi:hypothetical protein CMI37_16470 [Candidatus Pacearchaeota archaeon]|nr:hypothetical protein [Candidatus Pacearchaeota archaeon]